MNKQSTKEIMEKVKLQSCKLLNSASNFMSRCPPVAQLGIGAATGWFTGKVTNKVGTQVMVPVGGTVILVGAAASTGLIQVNWNKFGNKAEEMACRFEQKMPAIKSNISRCCRGNMFAIGLVGGFLLGFAR